MPRRSRRFLVALTGSPEPELVLEAVCRLAGSDDAVVALVVIEVSPLLPLDARMDADEAAARSLLARARAAAEAHGLQLVPRVVRAREAETAIVEAAEEEGAELVLVGSGGLRRPRAQRRLLRRATGSVLVV